MNAALLAILTGTIDPAFSPHESSAIAKQMRSGPLEIGLLGLQGDHQADLSVHGGVDKAIHHYPFDHYPYWRSTIGAHPLLDHPGAFGENIATTGLTEDQVCLGDRFRLGTALVEVSQGRQPCWKQGHRLGDASMVARIVSSGFSGWYYRVLEPGLVQAGDRVELLDRPYPDWPVRRAFALLIAGVQDRPGLEELAAMAVLAQPWRERAHLILERPPP